MKYNTSRSGYCLTCGRIFDQGERIFQLAKGTYHFPAITPTLWTTDSVAGEWHLNCLGVLVERLHPQTQPYHCSVCARAEKLQISKIRLNQAQRTGTETKNETAMLLE